MGRSRSSSRDRDRSRDRSHDRHRREREKERGRDEPEPEGDQACLRIGIWKPRSPISKEQITDELDAVRMTHCVSKVVIEDRDNTNYEWARVYFLSPESADDCLTELNMPGRSSKWRVFVSQRLPLPGPYCGEIGTIPEFEAFPEDPADSLALDTQEGFISFSTDELYRTKGLEDFLQAKRSGKTIRRLICKHFDPQRKIPCRFGLNCTFVHVKACAMNKLLRTVPHRQALRATRNDEDIQVSTWEFERRQDTLVVRDLDGGLDLPGLRYMFENCAGFTECFLRPAGHNKQYGIIRFSCRDYAIAALVQTYNSDLNISFFGAMEDARILQHRALKGAELTPSFGRDKRHFESHPGTGAPRGNIESVHLPFPPLPEGWVHGESRRTNQYYFYQLNSKEKTSWRHPVTKETYNL